MNIFYLHQSPYIAAKVQYNKHVVNEASKEMEREYEELREKAKEANLIWLSKQREAVKKAKEV